MSTQRFFCASLVCSFFLGTLLLGFSSPSMAQSADGDGEVTHYGGCIILSRASEAPSDLYTNTGIVATDQYKPFTKKVTVYGFTLVGRDEISDDFMRKVAKTIAEMLPRGDGGDGNINAELQESFIRDMYEYNA